MYAYRCPSCGDLAYSSANAATVGACPGCSAALGSPLDPAELGDERRVARAGDRASEPVALFVAEAKG
jgi:hypothetical protein